MKCSLIFVFVFLTGCSSITLQKNAPSDGSASGPVTRYWQHNLFWSLWEVDAPKDLSQICGARTIESVRVRQNAWQSVARVLTVSFWDPWEVSVQCSVLTEAKSQSKRAL